MLNIDKVKQVYLAVGVTDLRKSLFDDMLNEAERSIKPFVIGRKNWLFSNTPVGVKASALIETAKENKPRVHEYLQYLLTQLKEMETHSDEDLDKLLPWSKELPESYRIPD